MNYLAELEGIIGTILGIIVGAMVSYFQTNFGRIKGFFEGSKYYFNVEILDENDTVVKKKMLNGINSTQFIFFSKLDLYNSSNTKKILRNIKFCVETNKGTLYEELTDENLNTLQILNLDAKSIVTFPIFISLLRNSERELIFTNEISSLYLEYENEKGKKKRVKIHNNF